MFPCWYNGWNMEHGVITRDTPYFYDYSNQLDVSAVFICGSHHNYLVQSTISRLWGASNRTSCLSLFNSLEQATIHTQRHSHISTFIQLFELKRAGANLSNPPASNPRQYIPSLLNRQPPRAILLHIIITLVCTKHDWHSAINKCQICHCLIRTGASFSVGSYSEANVESKHEELMIMESSGKTDSSVQSTDYFIVWSNNCRKLLY